MAAATRKGKSIIFDAVTDTYAAQIVFIQGITFQGTGLTAGQNVLLLDDDGDIVADYLTAGTSDNADLWNGRQPQMFKGLKMSGTVDGTWALTVFCE